MAKRKKNPPHKWELTDAYIRTTDEPITWDTKQIGLVLRVRRGGAKTFACVYYHQRRPRWYTIDRYGAIGLTEARDAARKIRAQAALGEDPQAEKMGKRRGHTFKDLVELYLELGAPVKSRSQYQRQLLKHAIPAFRSRPAAEITRAEVGLLLDRRSKEAPASANLLRAAISSVYRWAIAKHHLDTNPVRELERAPTNSSRERTLELREIAPFWRALDELPLDRATALRVILLTGQRPGEVCHMRRQDLEIGEHVFDYVTRDNRIIHRRHRGAWWNMPGQPTADDSWPGTKNKQRHRVWLSGNVLELLVLLPDWSDDPGYVFPSRRHHRPISHLDGAMRKVSELLGLDPPVTPHDLRRTHGTMTTRLGFTRDAMDRSQNHKKKGVGSIYDRHDYADETRRVQEAVGRRLLELAKGGGDDNVIELARQA